MALILMGVENLVFKIGSNLLMDLLNIQTDLLINLYVYLNLLIVKHV